MFRVSKNGFEGLSLPFCMADVGAEVSELNILLGLFITSVWLA